MDKILQRLTGLALKTALAAVLVLGFTGDAVAQVIATGACQSPEATANLDINNVKASMYANGNIFWRGSTALYEVPKNGGVQAIFASGFWLAGKVGSDVRVAGATYGRYKFWTGPIFDGLQPPADCNKFDKLWKINRSDIVAFEGSGVATPDLLSWPTGLGAPTLSPVNEDGSEVNADGVDNDNDGEVDESDELRSVFDDIQSQPVSSRVDRTIDLAGGERPDMIGDQMIWWINNDLGNDGTYANSTTTETSNAMGVEMHNTAFAFNQSGDIGNTTFYKVKIFYKNTVPLTDAYVTLFSDPDLGAAFDDYVASDSTLGLGIVYNADNDDDAEYGLNPPAAGYDFFQGPIVPSVGDTAQVSGVKVPDFKNLSMTSFMYYNNGGEGLPYTDPRLKNEYYAYMQGIWKDGSPIRASGDGYNTTETKITKFMYSGRPGDFWSEFNADGIGTANTPADRRFLMSSGPFTIQPNDVQEIVYGVVWARGQSNLDSYDKLLIADQKAQAAFDANFVVPDAPDAPVVTVAELDGQVLLTWDNPPSSNNFLDAYHEFVPSGNPENPFYDFEGYEVWQFDSEGSRLPACLNQQSCRRLAVYDVVNGITNVIDDENADGLTDLVASGTDAGVAHSISLSSLTNYKSYYLGVRAYGYNDLAAPPVLYSPMLPFEVIPSKTHNNLSDAAVAAAAGGNATPDLEATLVGIGDGAVTADVVNPAAVRSCEYQVRFYTLEAPATTIAVENTDEEGAVDVVAQLNGRSNVQSANKSAAAGGTTFDIFCGDEKVFDGSATGEPIPQKAKFAVIDGLEFSVQGPDPGIKYFTVNANAAGPLDPPEMGTFAFNSNGYPTFEGSDRPDGSRQQTNGSTWGFHHGGGSDNTWSTFLGRVLRNDNQDRVGIYDYEMRWTAAGGQATRAFDDGVDISVPYELWRSGINTPDDPSDDVRLVPYICEEACGAGAVANQWDITGDSGVSGGDDDPASDWTYWYLPEDETPGQAGYDAWFALTGDTNGEIFARTILVNWNGGSAPPYDADQPEEGTVFRITTFKPNQPGDVYSFNTSGLEPTEADQAEKIARLEGIGVSPNPYLGASTYERSQLTDQVRFTNLPDQATIRVFTLNGSLLKTLQKNSVGQESLIWDVTTDNGLPMASGMYLIHVEVPGVGSKVIKFGYVKKVTRLNTF